MKIFADLKSQGNSRKGNFDINHNLILFPNFCELQLETVGGERVIWQIRGHR